MTRCKSEYCLAGWTERKLSSLQKNNIIKMEDKKMFYVTDYYTGEIITCVDSFELAKKLCNMYDGTQVETEDDVVLYANIDLPF